MREPAPCSSDAGFTLLELLVTMTLLAMLSLAILAAAHYGTHIWHTVEADAGEDNRILLVQSELQSILERAYPKFVATTATDGHVDFDGRADGFSFIGPDDAHPGRLLRLRFGGERHGHALFLIAEDEPELANELAASRRRILLNGISAAEFAYYGKSDAQSAPAWCAQWQGRARPPQLVRLRLAFADKSARPWPEFIAAPRIGTDVGVKR